VTLMIVAVPKGWLSWDYDLLAPTGEVVAEVFHSFWRERGSVVVSGTDYTIRRDGWLGPFILESHGDSTVASAVKTSPLLWKRASNS
jgi:hypothetical protein